MNQIQFTKGCPNDCEYCYEHPKMEYFNPDIPEDKQVNILDMNFLANPNAKELLRLFPKKQWMFVCGIDYRRLDQEICNLMMEKGFYNVRWAWDYGFSQQKIHKKVWQMFLKAGYRREDLSVFVLVNWKIPFSECCKKLDLLKVWNVKVNDCCFDGGYPKNEIDYNKNPRFNVNRFWQYSQIQSFRGMCRFHNIIVSFKIDAELKSKDTIFGWDLRETNSQRKLIQFATVSDQTIRQRLKDSKRRKEIIY